MFRPFVFRVRTSQGCVPRSESDPRVKGGCTQPGVGVDDEQFGGRNGNAGGLSTSCVGRALTTQPASPGNSCCEQFGGTLPVAGRNVSFGAG